MASSKVTFWGREPVLFLGLFAVALQVATAFWVDVSADQQAVINTAAAAVVGVIIAIVAHDSLSAPLLGGVQALLAAAVGFGLDWSASQQAVVLSLVGAVIAVFVRQVVTAPVAPPVEKQLVG
jgi:hypothetical protein